RRVGKEVTVAGTPSHWWIASEDQTAKAGDRPPPFPRPPYATGTNFFVVPSESRMSTSVSVGATTGAVVGKTLDVPSEYVTVIVPSALNAMFVMTIAFSC